MTSPLPQDLSPERKQATGIERLGRKLRLLVSGAEEHACETQSFAVYEVGKRRRYELLLTVNGGAYALATWLAGASGDKSVKIGGLEQTHGGLGMAAFAAIM